MITITWPTFIFIIVTLLVLARLFTFETGGDYNFDFRPILLILVYLIFFAVWGGIFWW